MFDPKSKETIGHHLFLEPDEPLLGELSGIIRTLSETYGGPVFDPHVTLLARIEDDNVMEKARILAREMLPLTLRVSGIEGEDEYFRAFYLKVEPTPELMDAHSRANELFGMEDARAYAPHLSLFYGNIDDDARQRLRAAVPSFVGTTFTVSTLSLFKTAGAADLWQRTERYPLGR